MDGNAFATSRSGEASVSVTPTGPLLGAEVSGVDLTQRSIMDPAPGHPMVFLYRRAILDEWIDRGDVSLAGFPFRRQRPKDHRLDDHHDLLGIGIVRADLRAISERIRRYAIPVASRAGYALYDRFLKANRVEAGVRSYGEVVRLLLGTRFSEDGAPVLRPLR